MDWVRATIIGVLANCLYGITVYSIGKVKESTQKKQELINLLENNPNLSAILQKATASVAKHYNSSDDIQTEKIKEFLTSPEFDLIIRQIYSSDLYGDRKKNNFDSIHSEFLKYLSLHLDLPEQQAKEFATDLLDDLIVGCEESLSIAIDKGILSAHEAMSISRHRVIRDELKNLNRNIESLNTVTKQNVQDILEFEEKYRAQVANRHKDIKPPYFDSVKRIPINDIYVLPDFVVENKQEETDRIKACDFLDNLNSSVILGNPGGGKSTFAQKICHDLSTQYDNSIMGGRKLTPILVILREFGIYKKEEGRSILQFIETTANSKYQVQVPNGAFDYLLLNGRVIVIFDGLDELLDTSYRQEISGDIESFCNLYPSLIVLVTSREIGYEQAPLDIDKFRILKLAPFDMDQIEEYASKWFRLDPEFTPEQRERKVESFLKESEVVPDLRSNPLMLSLICNIYRGENYIPKNRPDVYEKCALMLFERWDKNRGINLELPFEERIRPTMMHLAYWIYQDERIQGGVTEDNLIKEATKYLYPRRFDNIDTARTAAREFIEFCRGRAWVFTDTGTTADGDRLYQFTHRTFLEYFTACHLVRIKETTKELTDFLIPKISNQEWDVVAQLAVQIKNRNTENAADNMLMSFIRQNNITKHRHWSLLYFSVRCLEFIVPSPNVIREITKASINFCIDWYSALTEDGEQQDEKKLIHSIEPRLILGHLLHSSPENIETIVDSIKNELSRTIINSTGTNLLLAVELGLDIRIPYLFGLDNITRKEDLINKLNGISEHIFKEHHLKIKNLYQQDIRTCFEAMIRYGDVDMADFIKWHGPESLFMDYTYLLFSNVITTSYAHMLLHSVHRDSRYSITDNRLKERLADVKKIGKILLSKSPPWIKFSHHIRNVPNLGPPGNPDESNVPKFVKLDSNSLFGFFCLMATFLEIDDKFIPEAKRMKFIKDQFDNKYPLADYLHSNLLSRFIDLPTEKRADEIKKCGFNQKQQKFISDWIDKKFDLVQFENIDIS